MHGALAELGKVCSLQSASLGLLSKLSRMKRENKIKIKVKEKQSRATVWLWELRLDIRRNFSP